MGRQKEIDGQVEKRQKSLLKHCFADGEKKETIKKAEREKEKKRKGHTDNRQIQKTTKIKTEGKKN